MHGAPVVIVKINLFVMVRTEHITSHLLWVLVLKKIRLLFYALVKKQAILRIVMGVITGRYFFKQRLKTKKSSLEKAAFFCCDTTVTSNLR